MPKLTDKEIADRVRAKRLEIKTEREEVEELRYKLKEEARLNDAENEEFKAIIEKLRVKQYLLEEILGIE